VPTITTLQRGKKGIITTKQQHKESFQKEDLGDLGSIESIKMKERSWSVVGPSGRWRHKIISLE
jgi:hypothetical protein